MNPGLALALSHFYEVQLLVICTERREHHEDLDLWSSAALFTEVAQPWATSFVRAGQVHRAVPSPDQHTRNILVSCDDVGASVSYLDSSDYFRSNVIWLVAEKPDLDSLPLRLDSQLLVHSSYKNGTVGIDEVYSLKGDKLFVQNLGWWNETAGLAVPQPSIWERRADLEGATLINTALEWAPLIGLDDGKGQLWGLFPDIIGMLQARMNFSLKTIAPEDGKWASVITDSAGKEWLNGMGGQLANGMADISISTLTMTSQRSHYVDFTVGVVEDVVTIVISNPALQGSGGQRDVNLAVFLTIFTKATWLSIFLVALLVSTHRLLSLTLEHGSSFLGFKGSLQVFMSSFHLFFLSLIQKMDSVIDNVRLSSRITFLFVTALTYILFNYYVGDLTATMTAGPTRVTLRSFQDILNQEYVTYYAEGTVYEDFFKFSENPVVQQVYKTSQTMKASNFVNDLQEVVRSNFKIAGFLSAFNGLGQTELLFLTDFDDAFISQLAFPLQKNSELKSAFDFHLVKLEQLGLLRKLRHAWLDDGRPEDMSHRIFQDDAVALGYENLFFPSLVMLLGTGASALVVWAEKAHGLFARKSEVSGVKSTSDDQVFEARNYPFLKRQPVMSSELIW